MVSYNSACPILGLELVQGESMGQVEQVRDTTAFSIHFFIVHHIKITIHLPYCDLKLVYNNNTKIKYTLKDCVVFS